MDNEILKYLLLIPVSVLLKYIESRYLSDIRKRKNLFENIQNESIHKCLQTYNESTTSVFFLGTAHFSYYIQGILKKLEKIRFEIRVLMLVIIATIITSLAALLNTISVSELESFNFTLFNGNSGIEYSVTNLFNNQLVYYLSVYLILQFLIIFIYIYSRGYFIFIEKCKKYENWNLLVYFFNDIRYILYIYDTVLIYAVASMVLILNSPSSLIDFTFKIRLSVLFLTIILIKVLIYYNLQPCKEYMKYYSNREYKNKFPYITIFTNDGHIAKGKIESVFTNDVIYLNDGEETTIVKWESVDTLHIDNRDMNLKEEIKTLFDDGNR